MSILEEAAKLAENELQPLNRPGHEEGCHFENGVVRTPKGFKEAYRTYTDGAGRACRWIPSMAARACRTPSASSWRNC